MYTCNGSPHGCEGERFGGCEFHERNDPMHGVYLTKHPPVWSRLFASHYRWAGVICLSPCGDEWQLAAAFITGA